MREELSVLRQLAEAQGVRVRDAEQRATDARTEASVREKQAQRHEVRRGSTETHARGEGRIRVQKERTLKQATLMWAQCSHAHRTSSTDDQQHSSDCRWTELQSCSPGSRAPSPLKKGAGAAREPTAAPRGPPLPLSQRALRPLARPV